MPKVPTDYTKIVIYKLVHKEDFDNANIYIGSTTNFTKRKSQHKFSCLNKTSKEYHQKKYQSIRDNGSWNQWNMIEIEKYPCNDKREAETKEEYWRTHFNAVLNSRVCSSLTNNKTEYEKIYRENNKEKITQYRQDNKKKIAEQYNKYIKDYRVNNKEKIAEYLKEYRENHKKEIKQYKKMHYETNKEKISETDKEKISETDKGKIAEYLKEYRNNNKEKINQQRRENYLKKKEQNNQTI